MSHLLVSEMTFSHRNKTSKREILEAVVSFEAHQILEVFDCAGSNLLDK